MNWNYERLDKDYKIELLPVHDLKGEYTGKPVINLKSWMDEHPAERKAQGWIKHIEYSAKEIKEKWPHNPKTQNLFKMTRQVDRFTVEDDYKILDKSEEQLALEEILSLDGFVNSEHGIFLAGGDG